MRRRSHCFKPPSVLVIWAAFSLSLFAPRAAEERQPASSPWEQEIRAFEAADKISPPPQDAILFLGSSSIRLWKNLAQTFPGHKVLNRGFGGSQLADSVAFANRIVIPYKPKLVLLYAGDNDIASGKPPEQVLGNFKAFVRKIHAALPKTRIAYLAIKPCPARESVLEGVRTTNRLIREYCASDDTLLFIDLFTPMLNAEGRPRAELFLQDGLHPNAQGYKVWASVLRPVLDKMDGSGSGGP